MDRRECTHASYSSNSGRGSIPRRESSFILLIDLVINVKRRETKVGEKGREKISPSNINIRLRTASS